MTSASTLIRRARKAKSPRVAKRLRTMAAKLRRAARDKAAAKKATTRKTSLRPTTKKKRKPRAKPSAADPLAGIGGINRDNEMGWQVRREGNKLLATLQGGDMQGLGAQAGAAGLIDGDGIEMMRALARHKYKPGEVDQFAIGLRARLVEAKVTGGRQADEINTNLLKTVHEVNRINVVSAFMARLEGVQKLNNGPLPPTVFVDGFTLARVYDALRDAGYTTEGKGGVNRGSLQATRR